MDLDKAAETEPSWAPLTPIKPILPKPNAIYEDMQENHLEAEESSDSDQFPPGFAPEAQGGPTKSQDLHDREETETGPNSLEGFFAAAPPMIPATPGATKGTFTTLLALADAAVAPTNGFFLCSSDSYFWRAPSGEGFTGDHSAPNPYSVLNFVAEVLEDNGDSTDGPSDHPTHTYDLNLPPETMEDVVSETTMPQFAPITPNKSLGMEYHPTTQEQLLKKGDEFRRIMLEEARQGKELVDSASAVSKNMENLYIEKVDEEQGVNSIKTPQHKPRKKHRPKVVKEGKPKRMPKPKTPKSSVAVEGEKRVKRKYERRKGIQKLEETSPEEVTGNSIGPIPDEPSRKSCRRALNFDSEEQTMNKANDIQTKAAQVNSTHHFGQGFDVDAAASTMHKSNQMQDPSITLQAQVSLQKEQTDFFLKNCNVPGEHIQNHTMIMSGIRFNSLQAYEALPWVQNIHKKRRSDKVLISSSGLSPSTSAEALARSKNGPKLGFKLCINGNPVKPQANVTEVQDKGQGTGCILAFSQNERSTKKRSRVRDLTSQSKFAGYHMLPTYPSNQVNPHTCIETLHAEMQAPSRKKRTKRPKENNPELEMQLYGNLLVHQNHLQALHHSRGCHPRTFWRQIFSVETITEQLGNLDINRESFGNENHEINALVPYRYSSHENEGNRMMVLYRRDGTIVSFDPVKKRKPRPKVDLDDETTRVWKLLLEDINSQGIDGTDEEKTKWWEEERRVFKGRADSFIARMHLVQGDRRFSPWKGSVVDSVVGVFLTQNVSDHLSSSAFMSLVSRYPPKSKQNQSVDEGTSSLINEPDVSILDLEYTSKWSGKMPSPACSMTVNETENNEEVELINSEEFSRSTTRRGSSKSEATQTLTSPESANPIGNSTSDVIESVCRIEYRRAETDAMSFQDFVISSQNSPDSMKAPTAERRGSSSENSGIEDPTERYDFSKTSSFAGSSSTSFMQLLHMAGSSIPREFYIHESGDVSSNENSKNCLGSCRNSEHCKDNQNVGPDTANSMLEDECSQQSREAKSSDSSKIDSGNSISDETAATNQSMAENKFTSAVVKVSTNPVEYNQFCSCCPSNIISSNKQTGCPNNFSEVECSGEDGSMEQHQCLPKLSGEKQKMDCIVSECSNQEGETILNQHPLVKEANRVKTGNSRPKSKNVGKQKKKEFDWDSLRKQAESSGAKKERTPNTMDSVDWEAIRSADVTEIAQAIKERGMNNVLAGRIQDFLNRIVKDHGGIDLEWLKDVPPDKAKEYLLSIRGLGLKSVECVRLLTLHHLAFPVDTNVGRIAVRLGWVPLQPLPDSLQLHLLELYPVLESIQKFLWPRLCKLDQRTLYELHYQMITFGKVFCTKSKPNCNACPMRGECRHFASAFASARLALPEPKVKSIVSTSESRMPTQNNPEQLHLPLPDGSRTPTQNNLNPDILHLSLPPSEQNGIPSQNNAEIPSQNNPELLHLQLPPQVEEELKQCQEEARPGPSNCQPIIEEPASPQLECTQMAEDDEPDIEDFDEIPTIKLNIEEFTQNLQNYMQQNMELQEGDMSKALVALTSEAASIPVPRLKNVSRLRTEHLVYELPEGHPLLDGLDKLEEDDPCRYLLAIWTPGETATSVQPPEKQCNLQELGTLCDDKTCFSCHSIREANAQTVRGTILIPCRTAMRGSFPLNGTYFQVNEVFADHESSLQPIDVPRDWLWKLHRRTVYFGTSIPTIFKGLTTEGIQHCFWRGYVCVRGFDRKTRAPRPLMARLHFPASKLSKGKEKADEE